jgi:hypothetical protein
MNIQSVIAWYLPKYPEKTIPLLELNMEVLHTSIDWDQDRIENACQRICNPCEFDDFIEDSISWSEYL